MFWEQNPKLIETLDLLNKKGVEFVSLSDNIDTSTAARKAMFGMMAVFAEFDSRTNSSRA
jgi:DNA invertase Pin-like site-specific DNA recombinase